MSDRGARALTKTRLRSQTRGLKPLLLAVLLAPAALAEAAPGTLEDIYGDTGNTFQGALGFVNVQGGTGFEAETGFGQSIDDMVIEWREFTLVPDQSDCAAGSCAVVSMDVDRFYGGPASVGFRVMDASPYGAACDATGAVCYPSDPTRAPCVGNCVAVANDCDWSGRYGDGLCSVPAPPLTPCNDLAPASGDAFCSGLAAGSTCSTPDDDDCDDDGAKDLTVRLSTDAEPLGEPAVANAVAPGSNVYEGSVAVSVHADTPGVLFAAAVGGTTLQPAVRVRYFDRDDGTGHICENAIIPDQEGFVEDAATLFGGAVCPVQIAGVSSTDNGDGDEFPDSDESATVTLSLKNDCGMPLHDCLMRISTNSPLVECIFNPVVPIPVLDCEGPAAGCTLAEDTPFVAPPFQYRLGRKLWTCDDPAATPCDSDGDCTGVRSGDCVQSTDDPPRVTFTMTLACDEIDGVDQPQSFTQSVDLSYIYDPQDQTTWSEDFEASAGAALAAGGTKFYAQNNDGGIACPSKSCSLMNADGYRCQYSDPDWYNSNSSGNSTEEACWPGQSVSSGNAVYWQIDGQGIAENKAQPDGRAKGGTRSLYFGVYDQVPATDVTDPFVHTTPNSTIEAAATTDPVNLSPVPAPQLSFWHSVSLLDGRRVQNIPTTLSSDRGIVALQVADTFTGEPVGDWIKIVPYQNAYDTQAAPNFFNCQFDPIDDGNTEDDFFDPTDPGRSLGPSSTCFGTVPGATTDFCWSCIGDTEGPFSASEVCNGEPGSVSSSDVPDHPSGAGAETGTWLQSKFDLSEYRGRRVRLRFLVTSTKVGTADTWEGFVDNPDPRDDGWWIDDIEIDSTLVNPAVFTVDDNDNSALPPCGAACTSVSAMLTVVSEQATCDAGGDGSAAGAPCGNDARCAQIAGPGASCEAVVNPGQLVLSAPGQILELNAQGAQAPSVADACYSGTLQYRYRAGGEVVRDLGEDPGLMAAPARTTTYELEVRCSTLPSCAATEELVVLVGCPTTGNLFDWSLRATGCGAFDWETVAGATSRNPEIPGNFRVWRGLLSDLPNYGLGALVAGDQSGTAFLDAVQASPPADCSANGPSYYWLFARETDPPNWPAGCNADGWTSGGIAEVDGKPWTPGLCQGGTGAADGVSCNYSSSCKALAGPTASCRFFTNRDDSTLGGGLPPP